MRLPSSSWPRPNAVEVGLSAVGYPPDSLMMIHSSADEVPDRLQRPPAARGTWGGLVAPPARGARDLRRAARRPCGRGTAAALLFLPDQPAQLRRPGPERARLAGQPGRRGGARPAAPLAPRH